MFGLSELPNQPATKVMFMEPDLRPDKDRSLLDQHGHIQPSSSFRSKILPRADSEQGQCFATRHEFILEKRLLLEWWETQGRQPFRAHQ